MRWTRRNLDLLVAAALLAALLFVLVLAIADLRRETWRERPPAEELRHAE